MQAEMARLNLFGWRVAGITTRAERKGNPAVTVALFIVGWFVLFLTWPLMYWTWPRHGDVFVVTYAMGSADRERGVGRRPVAREDGAPRGTAGDSRAVGGGRERAARTDLSSRILPLRWRKSTWAIVIWTALCAYWLFGSLLVDPPASIETYGGFAIAMTAVAVLFTWFFGSLVLALVWLGSMPKQNTLIHGPQGLWMMVTEKEAKRWVEREGWSYYPQLPYLQPYQGQLPPRLGPPAFRPARPDQP